jgi:hypothetical protein
MPTKKKTYSFYGNTELDDILKDFQHKNNIVSKSEAMRLLLSTGLRNCTHPEDAHETETLNPRDAGNGNSSPYYELITGLKTRA